MPDTFTELKQPDAARAAHRRRIAVAAELEALTSELDLASAHLLEDYAPDRPTEAAQQIEASQPAAERAREKATAMRELAGLTDSDYPWADWVKGGAGANSFRDQLAQWEETAVQREDVAAHPDAYQVDAAAAAFDHAVAEARVEALRKLIDDLDQKARQHTPKANRAGRRAAGQRGPATAPDEAEPKP